MASTRLGLVTLFVLILGTFGSAQAQLLDLTEREDLSPRFGDFGIGFDKRVVGTWLGSGSFSVDFGCDGEFDLVDLPVTDVHTFGLGGTHAVVNPANPNSNLGTWTRTGFRRVGGRDISFSVDASPGGTLTFVSVVSFTIEFDRRFNVRSSTFGANVYLPTQDPLDPSEVPVACSSGQHDTFRKVSAK